MKHLLWLLMVLISFCGNAQEVQTILTNSSIADGMCTDDEGNVYTTSGGLAGFVVGRYSPSSNSFDPSFIAGLTGPTDVEFMGDSVLYITNYDIDRISSYSLDSGVLSTVAEGLDGPGGIETDQFGYAYVTNWGNAPQYAGHTITRISPNGNSWTYIDTSALYRPQAITWNHEERLVVHSNAKLYKINAADSTLEFWTNLPTGVGNMVFNSTDSCIYGASPNAGQILKINMDGIVSVFAGSTPGYADGPIEDARFEGTLGLTFSPSHDTLYVSEAGNINRLRRIIMNPDIADTSSLSIASLNNITQSLVFPNPLKGEDAFHIESSGQEEIDQISIFNDHGQLIYTHFSNGLVERIPRSAFDTGRTQMFFVKIQYTANRYDVHKILLYD